MKLSTLKAHLEAIETVDFQLENGNLVPTHFHVTEIGMVTKHFIDCGGIIRHEQVINFQLWSADDVDHRLKPSRLLEIIQLSEERLGIVDGQIEVEYQAETIGKYHLAFENNTFILKNTQTACLALDACGIPAQKPKIQLSNLNNTCAPGSGCC